MRHFAPSCVVHLIVGITRVFYRALDIRKRILGSEHPLTMKACVSMASLMCVEQRDYKQSFEYAKTVYVVRLRLFPADSKEIREVESAVFDYALLLLLAYARAGEHPSVVKKVALWSIDAAQKGLVDCGKKPAALRVAPDASCDSAAVSFERSMRGESRTKELQVSESLLASSCWCTCFLFVVADAIVAINSSSQSGSSQDVGAPLAAHLPPVPPRHSVAASRVRRESPCEEVSWRNERD
jgi:hypothetical protein